MSAIAWTVTHGNTDDFLTFTEQYERALTSKLVLTCGQATLFAQELLRRNNIPSRIALSLTLDTWNSYDNGHTMIEVFMNNGWVLYDLDNNIKIKNKSGRGASFLEFIDGVRDHSYESVKIANDTTLDVSSFRSKAGFNYGFYGELVSADIPRWYRRVVQVPLIQGDDGKFYFFDSANRSRIESYSPDFRYMDREEFMETFYRNIK